jgi:hypothetical protein
MDHRCFEWGAINAAGTFILGDWVTPKVPTWTALLEPVRNRPLSILEIGSAEGRSALFFASYLPNARIICIDPFRKGRERIFDKNLALHAQRVTKIRDFSLPALIKLRQSKDAEFDLIYIDGCHERETVMIDSVLCWGMLKLGGLMIWDDYGPGYKGDGQNWERPKLAIDGFLIAYAGEYREELSSRAQVIVRKTIATPRCVVRTRPSLLHKLTKQVARLPAALLERSIKPNQSHKPNPDGSVD